MSSGGGRPAALLVDLDALARNYERLRARCAPAVCAAVVKADAYGLGMAPVARKLAHTGCEHFFVARVQEALELRAMLPGVHIYVFDGVEEGSEQDLMEARVVPVLNSIEQIMRWLPTSRPALLQIDTGMTRLGLSAAEVQVLAERQDWLDALHIERVMTHLACADEANHPLNRLQLAAFHTLREKLPWKATSIANSAGIYLGEDYCGDLARPGIALYGGNPFVDRENPFEAVATLKARVLKIFDIDTDTSVGYGATFTAAAGQRIATLGLGYADGVRRALGNRGVVAVDGWIVPMVGRVSMDLLTIDVTEVPAQKLQVGDYVELLGETVTVDDMAALCDTTSYEILTGIGRRVQRVYLGND